MRDYLGSVPCKAVVTWLGLEETDFCLLLHPHPLSLRGLTPGWQISGLLALLQQIGNSSWSSWENTCLLRHPDCCSLNWTTLEMDQNCVAPECPKVSFKWEVWLHVSRCDACSVLEVRYVCSVHWVHVCALGACVYTGYSEYTGFMCIYWVHVCMLGYMGIQWVHVAHWVHVTTLATWVYTGYMCAFWVYVCTLDTCVLLIHVGTLGTCVYTGYKCVYGVHALCYMYLLLASLMQPNIRKKISKRQGFILAQSIMRRQVWWQAQEDALCLQSGSKFFPALFLLFIQSGSPEPGMVTPSLKQDLPISIRTVISEVWMMCIISPVQLHA